MKKQFTAFILTFGMLLNQSTGMVKAAESSKNAYGHSITYTPVTQLYTDGEPVRFFDAGVTEWGKLDEKIYTSEAESIKWLQKNNYLLNRFGRKFNSADTIGSFNSKGEWLTQITGPRNVRKWYANVRFDALIDKEKREKGNIYNMYDKGDLQYFFSRKVKTVQTKWGISGKSNDTGFTYALDESTQSSGGGWKYYNTLKDGPNLGNFSAWKDGKTLDIISFIAYSDKDNRVDSYLSGAMLVGRDIKGPRISSVRVTSDIDGKNELENGTVTLSNIDKLRDRTVYFQVEWNEPVMFKGISAAALKNLSLKINTIGIDGTSGLLAEAPFLKFAPSKKDGKPVMVFEYRIADPYSDFSSAAQERGYFYKFSSVNVSERENDTLWNHIYDISGNKFASDENGLQPSGKVSAIVFGSPKVDLTPFGVSSIRMSKTYDGSAYIKPQEAFEITLSLNKSFSKNTKESDLPKITLNVTDSEGKNISLTPDSFGSDFIKYRTRFSSESKADSTPVKVISVSSPEGKPNDNSGYQMMNYATDSDGMLTPTDIPHGAESRISDYCIAPDKQYKLDFDAPRISISASSAGNGIIMLTASADDSSLEGCEASFTVKANGSAAGEGMSFQAASSESYNGSEWKRCVDGATIISFSAPVISKGSEGKAYGFVRLPQNSESDKIDISVVIADEAENIASASTVFTAPDWDGYDTLAPTVRAYVRQEEITVDISDIDDEITYMYGFSEDESREPSYISADGKSGVIAPPELPEGNMIHSRVLWIKAADSHGNESDVLKLPVKYDRTYTEIICHADTEKQYYSGDWPTVEFEVKNAAAFWYVWAEKPANVSDTATYIADSVIIGINSQIMLIDACLSFFIVGNLFCYDVIFWYFAEVIVFGCFAVCVKHKIHTALQIRFICIDNNRAVGRRLRVGHGVELNQKPNRRFVRFGRKNRIYLQ